MHCTHKVTHSATCYEAKMCISFPVSLQLVVVVALQSVQQELQTRDGSLERIRVSVVSLVQGPGGSHLNAEGIHTKLENLAKRWKHLQTLAAERWAEIGVGWGGESCEIVSL